MLGSPLTVSDTNLLTFSKLSSSNNYGQWMKKLFQRSNKILNLTFSSELVKKLEVWQKLFASSTLTLQSQAIFTDVICYGHFNCIIKEVFIELDWSIHCQQPYAFQWNLY